MPLTSAARKKLVSKSLAAHAELDDDRLVELVRDGDTDALDLLLKRYTSYARAKAKTYFLIGADREDIIQEGMIGLFKAVRDYDPTKTVSFRSFAELCITRQIITAIKGATRQKHVPLNSYVSIHRPMGGDDDDGDRRLVEFLASARLVDPVEQIVAQDEVSQIQAFLTDILSDLEIEVLNLYLEGRSYQEIASNLRRQAKSIDNALQRIKRKLETFLTQREAAREEELNRPAMSLGTCSAGHERAVVPHDARSSGNGHHGVSHGEPGRGATHGSRAGVANGNGQGHVVREAEPQARTHRRPARTGDLRASLRLASASAARRAGKVRRPAKPKPRTK